MFAVIPVFVNLLPWQVKFFRSRFSSVLYHEVVNALLIVRIVGTYCTETYTLKILCQ